MFYALQIPHKSINNDKRTCSEPPKSAKKSLELSVTDVFPGWDCLRVMMNKE